MTPLPKRLVEPFVFAVRDLTDALVSVIPQALTAIVAMVFGGLLLATILVLINSYVKSDEFDEF